MKILKLITVFVSPLLLFCGCNKKTNYSSCPYIGNGSHYYVTAGSGSSFKTMHFYFYPNGHGFWGSTKIVNGETVKSTYYYKYTLTSGVNVNWKENISGESGRGYFATDTSGQVFVSEGLRFYRYS